MQVDGNLTSEDGPRGTATSVDINDQPLYVGGLPGTVTNLFTILRRMKL